MKKAYIPPTADVHEFRVVQDFAAVSGTTPEWDDLNGWTPIIPLKQ